MGSGTVNPSSFVTGSAGVQAAPHDLSAQEPEAARHLREAVRQGREWCEALLEAVGMWTLPEERFRGRHYRYLVKDEAFDWLVLAERLCSELDGMVPPEDKERLLFAGSLPPEIGAAEFRGYLGYNKHRAFLNFWYGVVVEEALQLAVEEEVRKEHRARGFQDTEEVVEESFARLYQDTRTSLLKEFLGEKGPANRRSLSLTEMKEFTYGLFKRRLRIWDPARVASDTRKGLDRLEALRAEECRPSR